MRSTSVESSATGLTSVRTRSPKSNSGEPGITVSRSITQTARPSMSKRMLLSLQSLWTMRSGSPCAVSDCHAPTSFGERRRAPAFVVADRRAADAIVGERAPEILVAPRRIVETGNDLADGGVRQRAERAHERAESARGFAGHLGVGGDIVRARVRHVVVHAPPARIGECQRRRARQASARARARHTRSCPRRARGRDAR